MLSVHTFAFYKFAISMEKTIIYMFIYIFFSLRSTCARFHQCRLTF